MPKLCGFCEENEINPDVVTYTCKNPDCANYTNRKKGPYPKLGKWVHVVEGLESSYKPNQLGWMFFALAKMHKPLKAIEVGILNGYSAIYTIAGMPPLGIWHGFDLWDKYEYNHVSKQTTFQNIQRAHPLIDFGLSSASLEEVPGKLSGTKVDMIHVDISNNGDTYLWCFEHLRDVVSPNGILIMEGGSRQRDKVDWMLKYNKPPISPVIPRCENFGWEFQFTINNYPSISIFRKKW